MAAEIKALARSTISQAVLGAEMLRIFDIATAQAPGTAIIEPSGVGLNGPFLVGEMGKYQFKTHLISNGEYASLAILNPKRKVHQDAEEIAGLVGGNLSRHPQRVFGLRTGFFDKDGDLILDPERFGDEKNPWGDIAHLATMTRGSQSLVFEEARAFGVAFRLASEILLSSIEPHRLLETD